jgi:ribosomal protein L11 methyltransferase
MAFGTAEHGTTRGALRLLDRALAPGERVLDVGAGSAILAVAAALLGAREVVAIEGDPVTTEYARENLDRNRVADRVRWIEAWADAELLGTVGPADGVVANIESGVLRRLLGGLHDALRPGGWLILSGLPAEEWDPFARDVIAGGFTLVDAEADEGWRSGLFRRPTIPSGLQPG